MFPQHFDPASPAAQRPLGVESPRQTSIATESTEGTRAMGSSTAVVPPHTQSFELAEASRLAATVNEEAYKAVEKSLKPCGSFRVDKDHAREFGFAVRDLLALRDSETLLTPAGRELARKVGVNDAGGDVWFVPEDRVQSVKDVVEAVAEIPDAPQPTIVPWHPRSAVLTEECRMLSSADYLAGVINREASSGEAPSAAPHSPLDAGANAAFFKTVSPQDTTPVVNEQPLEGTRLTEFQFLREAGARYYRRAFLHEQAAQQSGENAHVANRHLHAMHEEIGNAVQCRKAAISLLGGTWETAAERTVSESSKHMSPSTSTTRSLDAVGRVDTGQDVTALHRVASLPVPALVPDVFCVDSQRAASTPRPSPLQRAASSGSEGFFDDHRSHRSDVSISSLPSERDHHLAELMRIFYAERSDGEGTPPPSEFG